MPTRLKVCPCALFMVITYARRTGNCRRVKGKVPSMEPDGVRFMRGTQSVFPFPGPVVRRTCTLFFRQRKKPKAYVRRKFLLYTNVIRKQERLYFLTMFPLSAVQYASGRTPYECKSSKFLIEVCPSAVLYSVRHSNLYLILH